jgi:putative sterol carrier protein
MTEQPISAQDITPEQFAELVRSAGDEDIVNVVHATGTEAVLDRIFQGMQERFLPDRAAPTTADVQFVITDDGAEHPYFVKIANGSCETGPGAVDDPRTTITTDLVSFTRLVSGQAQGPQLFMSGKLKVAGDLMFSAQIMNFFEAPK